MSSSGGRALSSRPTAAAASEAEYPRATRALTAWEAFPDAEGPPGSGAPSRGALPEKSFTLSLSSSTIRWASFWPTPLAL